jgi:tRNA pseudouridine55 synthase
MQGILIINKPKGFTSQDVVSKVKKILNVKKAGHTGTLDPLATGVLPVLIGEYTKLSKYLIEHDKTYIARVKLGEKRDTGDSEGNIVKTADVLPKSLEEDFARDTLKSFLGKQKQTPPIYSAIKINGKKLYEYARENKEVDIPQRDIEIYNIKLLNIYKENNEIEFEVSCSKGTYIRVLCEDIAEKLGTVRIYEYANKNKSR